MPKLSDKFNAAFEFSGGFFVLLNILRVWRDKTVAGVSWPAVAFFVAWGFWNCWYYPKLKQRASFYGGMFVALMNTIWLILLIHYS